VYFELENNQASRKGERIISDQLGQRGYQAHTSRYGPPVEPRTD
jgi:hypothetical protein